MKLLCQKQNGAALIIVMALLTGASLLGLTAMQTAVVGEYMSGNYRAVVQANMNAESAYSHVVNEGIGAIIWGDEYEREAIEEMKWEQINQLGEVVDRCAKEESECFYFPLVVDGRNCLVAFGALYNNREERVAVSDPYFMFLE